MAITPVRAESPVHWPNACICGSQAGPLVDTGIQRNGEHIYLCELCTGLAAMTMGLVEGDERDRVESASKNAHRLRQENERLVSHVQELLAQAREQESLFVELSGQLAVSRQREDQLEDLIARIRQDVGAATVEVLAPADPRREQELEPEDEASARDEAAKEAGAMRSWG